MSRTSRSYEWIQQQHQNVYIPARVEEPSEFKRLKSSILIARQEMPNRVCGIARRVGWTQEAACEEAIYRLKLRPSIVGHSNTTIPGFFVLKDGIFVEYVPSNTPPQSHDPE